MGPTYRVCALISGGKDSCFSLMECVQAGHELVALANLKPPPEVSELDSYMFQSVGSEAIDLYSDCLELPLFRSEIRGRSLQTTLDYSLKSEDDEVEDVYRLLTNVKATLDIDAVCSGAILSDYQRVRVENVCARLNLVSLAYLWRRDQSELLQEMINFQMNSVLIKVASMGLDERHLGKSLAELQGHLETKRAEFGLNVCGEGGEYETFTLDCPLFKKAIKIEESQVVVHSPDAFSPVVFLHLKKLSLQDKKIPLYTMSRIELLRSQIEIRESLRIPEDLVAECCSTSSMLEPSTDDSGLFHGENIGKFKFEPRCGPHLANVAKEYPTHGWFSIANLKASDDGSPDGADEKRPLEATREVFKQLKEILDLNRWTFADLVSVSLLVADMAQYLAINQCYITHFGTNPPIRVCVETSQDTPVILNALGFKETVETANSSRKTMHVQSISHWAPANIGPYSQYVQVDNIVHVAGQIGLIPGSMELIPGGVEPEARLALRHVSRILEAHGLGLENVAQITCFVTAQHYAGSVDQIWMESSESRLARLQTVIVPRLPRGAKVEWQVVGVKTNMSDLPGFNLSRWNVCSHEQLGESREPESGSTQVSVQSRTLSTDTEHEDDVDEKPLKMAESVHLDASVHGRLGSEEDAIKLFQCIKRSLERHDSISFSHFQVFLTREYEEMASNCLEWFQTVMGPQTSVSIVPVLAFESSSITWIVNGFVRFEPK